MGRNKIFIDCLNANTEVFTEQLWWTDAGVRRSRARQISFICDGMLEHNAVLALDKMKRDGSPSSAIERGKVEPHSVDWHYAVQRLYPLTIWGAGLIGLSNASAIGDNMCGFSA